MLNVHHQKNELHLRTGAILLEKPKTNFISVLPEIRCIRKDDDCLVNGKTFHF